MIDGISEILFKIVGSPRRLLAFFFHCRPKEHPSWIFPSPARHLEGFLKMWVSVP
jgi:hypothetical protein